MLVRSIKVAAVAARRLLFWAAYGAFVTIVTATWITTRPASAEVPPGAALGRPEPAEVDASEESPGRGARKGERDDGGSGEEGTLFGPPSPEGVAARGEGQRGEPHRRGDGLRGRLNLNNATPEELQLLPGIGEAISARVIAWRDRNGRFHRVVDLRRVRGIGPKTLEDLRPYLTIIGPTTLRSAE